MPFLADGDKQALLDEQLQLKNTQVAWAAIGVLTLPVAAHVLFLPNVLSGLMVAVLKRQENAVDRALADPPRDDYARSTRARGRRYIPGQLGDNRLAAAADTVALATLQSAAYLEAMVRADERAQGARAANRFDSERERLAEAARMLDGFKAASWTLAGSLDGLSVAFAAFSQRPDVRRQQAGLVQRLPAPVLDIRRHMTPQTLAGLMATGLVVEDLDLQVSVPQPPSNLADGALDVARAASGLARTARAAVRIRDRVSTAESGSRGAIADIWSSLRDDAPEARGELPAEFDDDPKYEAAVEAAVAGDADAATRLGFLELDRGRFASARSWFELGSAAGNLEAQRQLASIMLEQGDVSSAESKLRTAVARGDVEAAVDLASVLARLGRADEAASVYEMALQRGSVAAAVGLALLLHERGERERAERLLRRAGEMGQDAPAE